MNIQKYKQLSNIISDIDDDKKNRLKELQEKIANKSSQSQHDLDKLLAASKNIHDAARGTINYKHSEFDSIDDVNNSMNKLSNSIRPNGNLIHVMSNIYMGLNGAWNQLESICISLDAGQLFRVEATPKDSREMINDLSSEFSLNGEVCSSFENGIARLANFRRSLISMTLECLSVLRAFTEELMVRHSKHGVMIYHSPVLTDFAMTIYNNVAHHGNVTEETTASTLTSYSANKAASLIDLIRGGELKSIVLGDGLDLTNTISGDLFLIWRTVKSLESIFHEEILSVTKINYRMFNPPSDVEFDHILTDLKDLDPNKVKYLDASSSMTEEQIRDLEHKNQVILEVCRKLKSDDTDSHQIISYIHERVKSLRNHYLNVNSFYICRIGQGNPLSGKSSGFLEVIPGKKPNSNFDEIIGSGFDEVKEFANHIKRMSKYSELFLMTSPRRTHDRANVLLIGPQGCGKTEALRAVANEEDSLSIFAQGSDFLTSWLGEAQKNPKRLFEAAVKLQKESKKHVHILIDEIDSVINDNYSTTNINLTLEFQMIMDGIVEYPNISVWGTTNHPDKIPMPMIRRFAKLLIVGELDADQRAKLLKHFFANLPLNEISEESWMAKAERLNGCTGDVIRKVSDHVWREQIAEFISQKPDEADEMIEAIKQINKDRYSRFQQELDGARADEKLRGTGKTRRDKFLSEFRRVWSIDEKAIDRAIDSALKNIGIINEIQSAKKTYDDARRFLAVIQNEESKDGSIEKS